ncbi:MAG TPA: MFS transporter [Phototrophicaceae bacterium]|nr:MFS transporter [Phototrophicaceae bacterium]
MNQLPTESNYRWYILILGALTDALALAMPSMCISVLSKEIATDLGLDLVQVGFIWGIGALPGIVATLMGGVVGDRFGPKRILIMACFLSGLAGALRGLSTNFITLAATIFLFGLLAPIVPINVFKACGLWFPPHQRGLANGVISMGMALGFMLGSMLSATWLSPVLGGWRNVLIFYGILATLLSIPWYFARMAPQAVAAKGLPPVSMRKNIAYVARIKKLWLLGWTILGISGCIQGMLGYLPLYLRGAGWPEASADGAASTFHLVSMICVVPIALLSDRLRTRKKIVLVAGLMIIAGIGWLSVAAGGTVWVAVVLAGMVRDGFMAVFVTMIVETKGVGTLYAGTATGFVMIFSGIGNLFAPSLGNSLAQVAPGFPFVFWAGLALFGYMGLCLAKEETIVREPIAQPSPQVG